MSDQRLSPADADSSDQSHTSDAALPEMTAAAVAYLREHGGEAARAALAHFSADEVEAARRQARARLDNETIEHSLTTRDAGTALGLSRSAIAHRIRRRSLYAFTVAGRWYLPRWQFQPSTVAGSLRPVPGIERIVRAIPSGLHPLAVQAILTTPDADFGDLSPIGYLRAGGDPDKVTDLLVSIAHTA